MCEDDSLLWADNVKTMFDATYKYISVCAKGALISTKKSLYVLRMKWNLWASKFLRTQ